MNSSSRNSIRIRAKVLGAFTPGFLKVILGPGVGMLDGGVPTEIPTELVPSQLRNPNTEFTVVQDAETMTIIGVEHLEEDR